MLDQPRRRWANVVQMLYKCVVFAGVAMVVGTNETVPVVIIVIPVSSR